MSRPSLFDRDEDEGGVVSKEEIAKRAFELKAESAKRSEEKHRQLQEQFKDWAHTKWMKRFEEEVEAIKEQKRIEEAEEQEQYQEERNWEKRGMVEVEKSISKVTLTFTGEEAKELLNDIELSVGLKLYPRTILEKLGVYLEEELR